MTNILYKNILIYRIVALPSSLLENFHTLYLLERVCLRLVRRHHNTLLVLTDYIAIDADEGFEFAWHDSQVVISDVRFHGNHVTMHRLGEDGIRVIDVIARHKSPLVGHHERDYAVVQGNQGFRVDGANLWKKKKKSIVNKIVQTSKFFRDGFVNEDLFQPCKILRLAYR